MNTFKFPPRLLAIALLLACHASEAQQRKDPFAAARDTTARWKRMPHVSLSMLGGGYGSYHDDLGQGAFDAVSGERINGRFLELAWRHHEGLSYVIEYGRLHQRLGDFMSDRVEDQVRYGDFSGIDQHITTIGALVGVQVTPFPRRHAVGFGMRVSGGLRYHRITEQYRFLMDQADYPNNSGWGWLGQLFGGSGTGSPPSDYEEYSADWWRMEPAGTASRGALSATLDIRPELYFGRYFSLILPDIQINLSLIKAHMPGAVVPDADGRNGYEQVKAHDVDLTYGSVSAGIAIHF